MTQAKLRVDEQDALRALHALDILDSEPEIEFDSLVRAASLICATPIALITLIDSERQWFKAGVGLAGVQQTPRDVSFCSHAVLGDALFEVPDAALDPRFADNPLVTGPPDVRFYAAAPLRLGGGQRIGTLCVIDRRPRQLDDSQRELLRCLAIAASRAMEGRRASRLLERTMFDKEARLRRLYEATPAMLHSIDTQGRLVAVSDLWLSKLGYDRDDVIGRLSTDFFTEASRQFARSVVLPAFFQEGHCEQVPYQMVTRDGGLIDVLVSAILERDDAGQATRSIAITEDVTLRRRAERDLEDSNQRLLNILDGTDIGTWEWNVRTGELRINERFAQIVGRAISGQDSTSIEAWRLHVHPDDLARSDGLLERHFARQSERYACEVRLRHQDGHWVWVKDRGRVVTWAEDGRPAWMFGTRWDITARKKEEAARLKAEEFLDRTGRLAGVGGWELDLGSGVLTWSAETRRIHGVAHDYQPTLEAAISFFTPQARPIIQGAVYRAIAAGEPWDLELQLVRADGSASWVRVVAAVDRVGETLTRLVGAYQDITQDLARAAELKRESLLREQVEQHAEELRGLLAERSEMLDVLAHEIRQPLNNASAALQSAAAALVGKGESAASARLERAQGVMGQVLAGIDNTLAAAALLAGVGQLERVDTDIDMLVAVVVADLSASERHRITVVRATATRTASTDFGLARLALRNLLSNALKYSPPGSVVELRIADSDDPLGLVLDISDQGKGFDVNLAPRMFERGARGAGGGTGLGLYIARRIMEMHGGRIELIRNTVHGSTMRLLIEQAAD